MHRACLPALRPRSQSAIGRRKEPLEVKNRQKGAAAALLTILLPAIVAMLGLDFDVGTLHARKREAQTAADATAIAAASAAVCASRLR
ncbi:MAG: hypothetical protein E4H03_07365, partial [Myxococcales bacterium]